DRRLTRVGPEELAVLHLAVLVEHMDRVLERHLLIGPGARKERHRRLKRFVIEEPARKADGLDELAQPGSLHALAASAGGVDLPALARRQLEIGRPVDEPADAPI